MTQDWVSVETERKEEGKPGWECRVSRDRLAFPGSWDDMNSVNMERMEARRKWWLRRAVLHLRVHGPHAENQQPLKKFWEDSNTFAFKLPLRGNILEYIWGKLDWKTGFWKLKQELFETRDKVLDGSNGDIYRKSPIWKHATLENW